MKLSASSIKTYEKCPKQYYYTYINKPNIPQKDWSHLELGKFAHRCLELFHDHLTNNIEEPSFYPKLMSISMKKALEEWKKENKDTLLTDELPNIQKILQSYLDKLKETGLPNVIGIEKSFLLQIEEFNLKGFIDRLDKVADGEYRIVDYKTNNNPKYLNSFQLMVYALAVKEIYPDAKKVHGSFILLKHGCKTMDWTFDESDYKKVKEEIIETGVSIKNETVWKKKPSKLCSWCDFASICQDAWCEEK